MANYDHIWREPIKEVRPNGSNKLFNSLCSNCGAILVDSECKLCSWKPGKCAGCGD